MNRFPLAASLVAAALVAALAPASPQATPEPPGAPSPTPSATYRPHHLTVTPVPLRPRLPRVTPLPIPTPAPTPAPTLEPTEAPTPEPSPTPGRRRGRATAAPVPPVPTFAPTPVPTLLPPPEPTPIPTARPTRAPRRHAPTPSPTAPPTQTPAPETPAPIGTLPLPTEPPLAPAQPSVTQSFEDPRVQSIIGRPIRELSQIRWMTGTWRARNSENLGAGRSRSLGVNTYVFGFTMHGRWLFGADGKASDFMYITYDPFAHRWVLMRFQGNPSYGIWLSESGWKGNRIVFVTTYSYANGRAYHRRLTIIHKDARSFGIYDEEQLPDGSWTADDAVELNKEQ